jgi:C-terminal processing protease CtpA/Prc
MTLAVMKLDWGKSSRLPGGHSISGRFFARAGIVELFRVSVVEGKQKTGRNRNFKGGVVMSKRSMAVMVLLAFVAGLVATAPAAAEKSEKAWLGVYLQDINRDLKEAMDLESKTGALIAGVAEDSPAEKAGIEEEDVIVEFDGEKVRSSSSLTKLVQKHSPGDEVTITLVRDGKEKNVEITLGKRPKDELVYQHDLQPLLSLKKGAGPESYFLGFHSGSRIGVKVQDLSEQLGEYFGVGDGEGALITEVEEDMPAQKAGLKAGDVIVEADGDQVGDTQELREIISEKEEGDKVEIKVIRDRKSQTFSVEVEESPASDFYSKAMKLKVQPGTSAPEFIWQGRSDSKLQDEMEALKDELAGLKKELQELRERLK